MLLILPRQLTGAADRQTLHTLLDGLDVRAARRGIALVAARIIVLILGPSGRAPSAEVAITVEVVKLRLAERAKAAASARREHTVHAIRVMAYLTAVAGQKGHRVRAVRPRAVAEGLIRKRSAGVVRVVRITGADRITRVMLSIVTTSPRVEAGVFASGMFRLLLLLVFLRAIAHCFKQNSVYSLAP